MIDAEIGNALIGLASLVLAVWAIIKADSAKKAAEEAQRQLRERQAPWRLEDAYNDVSLLRVAVDNCEWRCASYTVVLSRKRIVTYAQPLRGNRDDLAGRLDRALEQLEAVSNLIVNAERRAADDPGIQRGRQKALQAVDEALQELDVVVANLRHAAGV